ncbi:hypothetical protein [Caloramator sp. Dgby_cultured_2]|uniref:hypothetical protein n=1 Tax=Caloramator sp. Dgby_cultured_2 TaxID=3029174 RepID=UPI00237EDD87|nr:hypothetical protein [Caloramator sp. Dgby_cultured_2]WDU84596.1 hypothetical protein PWK10_13420 [Caloramator sp. Dgby_cultured_2]
MFEGDVESVLLNSLSGKIQILSRHATTIVGLVPRVIEIKTNEKKIEFQVFEGILDFEKINVKYSHRLQSWWRTNSSSAYFILRS